jgi:hypothetical protein
MQLVREEGSLKKYEKGSSKLLFKRVHVFLTTFTDFRQIHIKKIKNTHFNWWYHYSAISRKVK